jgi:hypothetical protein
MLFIVERATSVAQWLFVVYLLVVGVNMYRLFSPPQCSASDPATMCVPSAVGAGDRYDVWVWASPEESFHAIEDFIKGGDYEARTVHAGRAAGSAMDDPQKQAPSSADEESNSRPVELVHAFFGVRLNETVTANVTVPVRKFGTRNNGTLYVHAVLYYPAPKSAAGALYEARNNGWRPNAPPVAHVSSAFTKTLPRSDANYAMLLSRNSAKPSDSKDTRAGEGGIAVEVSSVSADASSNTCVAATEPKSESHVNDEETDACAASEELLKKSDKSSWKDDGDEDSASDSADDVSGDRTEKKRLPVTHLRPRLTLFVVSKPPVFDRRKGMPSDLPLRIVRAPEPLAKKGHKIAYAPLVMPDDVTTPRREYVELSADATRDDPTIALKIQSMHIGLFRLTHQMQSSLRMMSESFGMTESDLDDVKELFTGHDWRWMAATFVVSLLHSWFAFLAFKHDVGFWKKKSNLEGLSVRTQWSSFACQAIIFANLLDTGQASTIILAEMGVSVIIEGWKVSKFLVRDGVFHRLFGLGAPPKERTKMQIDTDAYDRRAMRVLSLCLYPIVLVYGGYSLVYHPQRSWRSWILRTLANGVYMFGFIAMTPQLYINYRLKSVAHMPWRAFMYKTFNTFIDDVFAFAVTMPLIHRIACLRDDLVFFVYLYQRRIYPVDKKRVNEFGRAYEDSDDDEKEGEANTEEEKKGEEAAAGDKGDASRAKKESKKRR